MTLLTSSLSESNSFTKTCIPFISSKRFTLSGFIRHFHIAPEAASSNFVSDLCDSTFTILTNEFSPPCSLINLRLSGSSAHYIGIIKSVVQYMIYY